MQSLQTAMHARTDFVQKTLRWSAIKGVVRGDVFWGFGADEESIAGRMKSTGKLYVLLPKALAAKLGASADYRAP